MENTAKNFAFQLGSLIALYTSVTALLVLLFGVITILFPDAAEAYWRYENAIQSIRFSIAVLIVFFPTYLTLTRKVNTIRRTEHGTYLTLTKWLIYLSLLVAGAVMLGDLVAIIHGFLSGELTIRFILKGLSMLVVIGAAFTYYLLDARSYWQEHERRSIQYGIGASIFVVVALVVGYMNIETPAEVREMRIDANQISDLQDIQWRIEEHYSLNGTLPESTSELYAAAGIDAPHAPEERIQYQYNVIDQTTFELCAEFAQPSQKGSDVYYDRYSIAKPVALDADTIINPYNWDHGAGEWCFERKFNQKGDIPQR